MAIAATNKKKRFLVLQEATMLTFQLVGLALLALFLGPMITRSNQRV